MKWQKAINGFFLSLFFLFVFFLTVQGVGSLLYDKKIFLGSLFNNFLKEKSNSYFDSKLDQNQENQFLDEGNSDFDNDLEIQGLSGVILETALTERDKILFEKGINERIPIASLTKLMTALIAVENYNLTEPISSLLKKDILLPGYERLTVKDLLYLSLIASDNNSALILSEIAEKDRFVSLMNEKAKEIGMDNTSFVDPTGLSPQNLSSIKDLIKLIKYILSYHPEIAYITSLKEYEIPSYGRIHNTNKLLVEIPNIVGGKTGFTEEAKGCLILVLGNSTEQKYSIYIVLGSNDRFGDIKKMIEWHNNKRQNK